MGEGSHIYRNGNGASGRRSGRTAPASRRTPLMNAERRKRAQEALNRKGAINVGLTKAQEAAVTKIENKNRSLKTERVAAVDRNGNIIARSSKGSRTRTALPPGYNYKDTVITHNHPNNNGQATRFGVSLSGTDLRTAIKNDAAEIRAVSGTHTYSLRRPKGGWGVDAAKIFTEWMAEYNKNLKEQKAHRDKLNPYAKGQFENYKQRHQRLNTLTSHMATKEIAKKYGLEYTRKRTQK